MSDQDIKPPVSLSPSAASLNSENPIANDNDTSDIGSTNSNGKERRKIEIKFIENKTRRHVTFSKRKHGIMKKAFELSVLTGTQVLLLVVSETGLVYTFSTPKFEPIVTQQEGRNLIQACLNAPDEEEEEEEEEDQDAQRQRLAAQQIQQAQQQVQQHQAAMQRAQQQGQITVQQQQQQQQQQQPPGPIPMPNNQLSQQGAAQLQQLQQGGNENLHPFTMDSFPTPNVSQSNNQPNSQSNTGNNPNNSNLMNSNSNKPDTSVNGNNNPNNPVYQQYFQSTQQQPQF